MRPSPQVLSRGSAPCRRPAPTGRGGAPRARRHSRGPAPTTRRSTSGPVVIPRRYRGNPPRFARVGFGRQESRPMNIAVCVKQIPDPAVPGQARRRPHPRPFRQAHPRRLRRLRRRDGVAARREGRRRRGRAHLHGAQRRGVGPAHRARDGRGARRARQRRRARGLRRAVDGQGAGEGDRPRGWHRARRRRDRVHRWLHRHNPAQIAELLGWPSLTFAKHVEIGDGKVTIQRQTEAGYDTVEASLPAVVSVTAGVVEPRYPSFKGIMAAKNKPVDTVTVADLGLSPDDVGWAGARQTIVSVGAAPERGPARRSRTTARRSSASSRSSSSSRSFEKPDSMSLIR